MLGDDIEKNRVEYVQRVEYDNALLREQNARYLGQATRWALQHNIKYDLTDNCLMIAVKVNDVAKTIRLTPEAIVRYAGDNQGLINHISEMIATEMYAPLVKAELNVELTKQFENVQQYVARRGSM